VNYGRELKIGVDIKIKKSRKDNRVCGKNEKKTQNEAGITLRKM